MNSSVLVLVASSEHGKKTSEKLRKIQKEAGELGGFVLFRFLQDVDY